MPVSNILNKKAISLNLKASDSFDAIEKMIQMLSDAEILPQNLYEAVKREVIEREKTCPTGLDHGVALPHAIVEGLSRETGAFAIVNPPIDFSVRDGRPADLIFLLLVPQEPLVPHVRLLSQIVRLLIDESNRAKIRCAKTVEEIYDIFR